VLPIDAMTAGGVAPFNLTRVHTCIRDFHGGEVIFDSCYLFTR
jgi:hypothetical protein